MSTYFSKVIKAGERQREFNFRQLPAAADPTYHVDVPDDKGNRIIFQMHQSEPGNWKTGAAVVPVWIQDAEAVLSAAILEQQPPAPQRRK